MAKSKKKWQQLPRRHRQPEEKPRPGPPPTPDQVIGWWIFLATDAVDVALKERIEARLPGWIGQGAPLRAEFVGQHGLPPKPWPPVDEMITCPSPQEYIAKGTAPKDITGLYFALSEPVVKALGLDLAPAYFGPRYCQSYNAELKEALVDRMRQNQNDELAARAYLGKVWESGFVLFAEELHTVMETTKGD